MTKQEFLDKLIETHSKFEWELDTYDSIRGWYEGHCFCPITAVCLIEKAIFVPVDNVDAAWAYLGINEDDAESIIGAADGNWPSDTRENLKSILGF